MATTCDIPIHDMLPIGDTFIRDMSLLRGTSTIVGSLQTCVRKVDQDDVVDKDDDGLFEGSHRACYRYVSFIS